MKKIIAATVMCVLSSSALAFTTGGSQGQGNLYLICEREIGRDVMVNDTKTINDLSFSTKHWCRTFMPEQIDYLLKYKRQEMSLFKEKSPEDFNKSKQLLQNESKCLDYIKKAIDGGKVKKYDDLESPYKEQCKNMQFDFYMLNVLSRAKNVVK